MRPLGVCNCPYRFGTGKGICLLDGEPCRVISDASGLWCRGWLPSGDPSLLQEQARLF